MINCFPTTSVLFPYFIVLKAGLVPYLIFLVIAENVVMLVGVGVKMRMEDLL